MTRKFDYTDILGWSASRYETFTSCKRQYYYQYYGKKYDPDGAAARLKIETLKDLTTVPIEIGSTVHEVFKELLKRIRKSEAPIDEEKFIAFARSKSEEAAREQAKFAEIHYGEKNTVSAASDIFPKVETALRNFLASSRVDWLLKEAAASKDKWVIEPGDFGECRIDNLKAYCKVDFLFPVGDELVIIDWKSGKSTEYETSDGASAALDKHARQMRGYMIWAHFQYEKEYEKIRPIVTYLVPEYREREVALTEDDIREFAGVIRKQSEEMWAFCADVELNIPLAKDEFPMTTDGRTCRFCNFRELCGPESPA